MLDRLGKTNEKVDSKAASKGEGQEQMPAISLPKGGGAIRGIGEKFSVNAANGTASISVPISVTPGRSGFGPLLSLSYDSGAGNGPFGLGWNLAIPSITRKTDKGLPRYKDGGDSDTYILSGAEDLVPCLTESGEPWAREVTGQDGHIYLIQRYRPRIEGLFARIERWVDKLTGDTHWRSVSKENITTLYGSTPEGRLADPADEARIFSWLIEESNDDKGNMVIYQYKQEDRANIDQTRPQEKNRLAGDKPLANRYIKRIKYGNTQPYQRGGWLFQVVFDYGDHQPETPGPEPDLNWLCRQDAFSTYRSGFEIRTCRLCQRVLMFHHFAEMGSSPCLVRSTDFSYAPDPVVTLLKSVVHTGYVRNQAGLYHKKRLPPLEFSYTEPIFQEEVHSIDPGSLENLPVGLDNARFQWVDLDSEGISGILTEQGGAWFYKQNLGSGQFAPAKVLTAKTSLANLSGGRQQVMDLAGDGHKYLVQFTPPLPGYYQRTGDGGWGSFTPFDSLPNIAFNDPNLKFIDLTGDGHADILITEDEVFTWHPSRFRQGFGQPEYIRRLNDEERGPALVFADPAQSIYLADMSGDGLADIVRIRSGEVCYWPNLGYGRFGARVTMDGSPWFHCPDQFNPGRIRLADVDGSGPTDIIYLGRDAVTIWFNQAGNCWSPPFSLQNVPAMDHLSAVNVVDLMGNGTACIVWSSSLPGDAGRPMRYIELMGGIKPHLLASCRNNLGAETRVQYTSSTQFYLKDRAAGKPWITKLPFPVHVVQRWETWDLISKNRFTSRYAYHHGYFDGAEREFRGFGLVEQWDTEEYATLYEDSGHPPAANHDQRSYVPPIYTKTWFHTGAYLDDAKITEGFASEYYREPNLKSDQYRAMLLEDTVIPKGLSAEEEREACRALKGSVLRQEVYGQDSTARCQHPYSVSEHNYTVAPLQQLAGNSHGVFFVHPRENVNYHYERQMVNLDPTDPNSPQGADPRVNHQIILKVDKYGNVEREAAIGYPRRLILGRRAEQAQTHITLTVGRFLNCDDDNGNGYHAGLPLETRTYEIVKPPEPLVTENSVELFTFENINLLMENLLPKNMVEPDPAKTWPYERWDWRKAGTTPPETRLRLMKHIRTLYLKNDLTAPLPLGQAQLPALPHESYKLAFTPGLLGVYQREQEDLLPDPAPVLRQGGYLPGDDHKAQGLFPSSDAGGGWWIPSGRSYYSPVPDPAPEPVVQSAQYAVDHFYLPQALQDPFGAITRVEYDPYDLLYKKMIDPVGNAVTVETMDADGGHILANDYRVLQPWQVTDPNGNRTEVSFDTLGLVAGTAVMGKAGERKGDTLEGFKADLDQGEINAFFADPKGPLAVTLLGGATTRIIYDVTRFLRLQDQGAPVFAATLARESHAGDPLAPEGLKVQVSFSYTDGFGREIQKKIQAEPGPVEEGGSSANPRWLGSGWTLFNNKGNPVKQFEPFFSDTHHFQFARQHGVGSTLFYDPLQRVVATLHPNHTYEKVVFDAWRQETWDVSDTIMQAHPGQDPHVGDFFRRLPDGDYMPTWHESRKDGQQGAAGQAAAQKAAAHAGTPAVAHFDPLGRTFLTILDNGEAGDGSEQKYETLVELDIEGNQRAVLDAKKREVMRFEYNMPGHKIKQVSMDAGDRWLLGDITEKPLRTWDSRNHQFNYKYDSLQRPLEMRVMGGDGPAPLDDVYERIVYGEGQALNGKTDRELNLRGKPFQHYDTGGKVQFEEYDFKGNPLKSHRRLTKDYKQAVSWDVTEPDAKLEDETFVTELEYDALNRVTRSQTADGSAIKPTYNDANLLEKMQVEQEGTETYFVQHINYNEKGQRKDITYGNGIITTYKYERETFRLVCLDTKKENGELLQSLLYTYDPVGNITQLEDRARPVVFFGNFEIKPINQYTYDPLYRLTEAAGREHMAQMDLGGQDNWGDLPFLKQYSTGDPLAWRNYTQQYQYDEVGNIQQKKHIANGGSWTRVYEYEVKNNRLKSTDLGAGSNSFSCSYPHHRQHGFMEAMPHLQVMKWNFRDELQAVARQKRLDGGTPETTYYTYDASGQRLRKVTENAAPPGAIPSKKCQRIYAGGIELYREYTGPGAGLERKTLPVADGARMIAMVETRNEVEDGSPKKLVRYQLGNHLGSACLETDDRADIISYEEYHPYGTTSYQAVDKNIRAAAKRYRYTGKERDEETGLYYHGARYYAPWLGRWTCCDPAGLVDGVNIYIYALNNPVKLLDPTGLQAGPESRVLQKIEFDKMRKDPPDKAGPEEKSDLSRMSANALLKGYGSEESAEKREEWYMKMLGPYQDLIQESAQRNDIPPQLLAAVILNELADIDFKDIIQHNIDVEKGSVGMAQIDINTAIEDNLVDIDHSKLNAQSEDELKKMVRIETGRILKTPKGGIEAAAREIRKLLNAATNDQYGIWAQNFLIKPDEQAGASNIYEYVKTENLPENIQPETKRQELNLARMITAAYNSPDILKAKGPGEPIEMEKPSTLEGRYLGARRHGHNSMFIANDLYRMGLFRSKQ